MNSPSMTKAYTSAQIDNSFKEALNGEFMEFDEPESTPEKEFIPESKEESKIPEI